METAVSLLEGLAGKRVQPSDTEDLAHEVLLLLFREIGGFERRHTGAFRAWVRTILVHRVRDHFRGQQYRPTATGDSDFLPLLAEIESPDGELSKQWDRDHDEHVAASLMLWSVAISHRRRGKRSCGTSSKKRRRRRLPKNWAFL